MFQHSAFFGLALLALGMPGGAEAQQIDFGDDASAYSNDGECDDPRFEGTGMTGTLLLEEDRGHDASDCAAAHAAGTITLRAAEREAQAEPEAEAAPRQDSAAAMHDGIDFGDDSGSYPQDGECDDPRFEGPAMAAATEAGNEARDATDCAAAYADGRISLIGGDTATAAAIVDGIDFGDDSGAYPQDGECDDPRFEGPAMAASTDPANSSGDATDCAAAYADGRIALKGGDTATAAAIVDGIDFGDDSGAYPQDGECDDPRFEGPAMAASTDPANSSGDATDCAAAYAEGRIALKGPGTGTEAPVIDGIDFGDDSGAYPQDGECDDPRFEGPAVAASPDAANTGRDASDCAAAFAAGDAMLRDAPGMEAEAGTAIMIDGIDFGDDTGAYPQDGECDDPRFQGPAVAASPEAANIARDATDCAAAYSEGLASLATEAPPPTHFRPSRRGAAVSPEERATRRAARP
jgi:hypothetical protein